MQGVAGDNFSILLQNWKSAKLEINKTGVTFVKGIPRTLVLETMEYMKNYSQFSIACSGKEKHSTQKNTEEPKKETVTLLQFTAVMLYLMAI